MLNFDKTLILEKLNIIPESHRIAFAASCCERLLPNYKKFVEVEQWGDYDFFRNLLNQIWNHILGEHMENQSIKQSMEKCFKIVPDSEDFKSIYTSYAIDSGAAVYNTLKYCLEGDLKLLMAVVNSVHATVDLFVQEKHNMNPSDPQLEQKILHDPFMHHDLKKQLDDLNMLINHQILDGKFINVFRSEVEGKSNIEL